jgi:hypothetical protein
MVLTQNEAHRAIRDWIGPSPPEQRSHQPRTAQEVARRVLVLSCVASAHRFPAGAFNDWLRRWHLWSELSALEDDLLTTAEPSEQQRINATWRSEALQVLLWVLGRWKHLLPMSEPVALDDLMAVLRDPWPGTAAFLVSHQLRNVRDLEEEFARVVAARDRLGDEEVGPDGSVAGVVFERYETLKWMLHANGEAWDEVSLDS